VLADEQILELVYEALAKRRHLSRTRGRKATSAEVVLRLLVLKYIRNWSYVVLEREVRANLLYHNFTRVGFAKMPDAKTMGRWDVAAGYRRRYFFWLPFRAAKTRFLRRKVVGAVVRERFAEKLGWDLPSRTGGAHDNPKGYGLHFRYGHCDTYCDPCAGSHSYVRQPLQNVVMGSGLEAAIPSVY
jgi:hypothetical protein